MYAQLGTTIFENSKGFTDYNQSSEAIFAEHATIIGKPKLESTGLNLKEVNLSIRLHISFCNPVKELESLKEMRDSFGILPLIWGNGKVEGNFVITSISENIEEADSQGNVFSYMVSLSLKEYVVTGPLQELQAQSRKNATAVGDKRPVAKKKVNDPTCPQKVTKLILNIYMNGMAIVRVMQTGGIIDSKRRNYVIERLRAIIMSCIDLEKICSNSESCAFKYPLIRKANSHLAEYFELFAKDIRNDVEDSYVLHTRNLTSGIIELKRISMSLIKQSITNNG